jgi:hypothetical protein
MSDHYEFHPLAGIFPLMEGEEFDALVADIKAHGLREPIDLYQGKIIDGRNRYRALLQLGIIPKKSNLHYVRTALNQCRNSVGGIGFHGKVDRNGMVAYIVSKNIHRRHLTAEQKRDALAALIAAQPEKSDRQIAKQAKVDHHKVGKVRKEEEDVGKIPHVEARTDTKGRKQPATKPLTAKQKERRAERKAEKEHERKLYADAKARTPKEQEAHFDKLKFDSAVSTLEALSDEARRTLLSRFMEKHPDEVDPEASAEAMKAQFAALDAGDDCDPDNPIARAWYDADDKTRDSFVRWHWRHLEPKIQHAKHVEEEQQKAERKAEREQQAQRLAKARKRGKTRKLTVGKAVEEAFATFADLGDQMGEWRDNIEEKFSGTAKFEAVNETATALESLCDERPNVPEAIAGMEIEVQVIKCKARWQHCAEAYGLLETCAEILQDNGCDDFCTELQNVASQAQDIEFPGMY